ncbi:MAG: LytR C-terminal domain-containing protein [Candidatus Coatesbacteria bacterium]|nr:LytR C-terminal domain-containing protein [Candidatus Coatesbacteria bacterium]
MNEFSNSELKRFYLFIFIVALLVVIREQVVLYQFWKYQAASVYDIKNKEIQSRYLIATNSLLQKEYNLAREEFLIIAYRFPGNEFEKSAKNGVKLIEELTGKGIMTAITTKSDSTRVVPGDTTKIDKDNKLIIEVVNGCGDQDATDLMVEALQKQGYDVKRVVNSSDSPSMYTKVINNGNSGKEARKLAQDMNIKGVYDFVNEDTDAHITVVVGADYLKKDIK